MNMLLAFSPFIAFVVLERLVGTLPGLLAGALTSIALLLHDRLRGGGQVKVLEAGTALLFSGLALWAWLDAGQGWSIAGVRLRVDLGLLLIVLVSLALRRPFTLQYARAEVSDEVARSPQFMRVNNVITGVWALAFALLVVADLLLLYMTQLPQRVAVMLSIAALYGAYKFTVWYPQRVRAQARAAA